MSSETRFRVFPSRWPAALIALPLLLSAACGGEPKEADIASAGPPSAGTSSVSATAPGSPGKSAFYDAQLAYTQCMRKEGLKDWPDPKLSGYPDLTKVEQIQQEEERKDRQTKLSAALEACKEPMQKAMSLEPEKDQQKVYESLLAHAQCMRANGVSKFTNPTMQNGMAQPGGDPTPGSPQIDPGSPGYKQAQNACRDKLIEQAQGMQ
ncbi:hypothetical protein [Amycolatopsis regifaucium]|uniref:Lipoprotein n=1 Tax=Amycolatopsis regifaucium TaxID=546365 RepID=A0A154MIE4_9PSEU|nr:hypothetical protein [Amycolatopsis regifaucium]KZB84171.1 hypothetical protein AVL48_34210 [Amycolatopsis regifaucium]OKA08664.1 hypothetical protein ATP06_0211305 [Amycolatopsis regifaucium]